MVSFSADEINIFKQVTYVGIQKQNWAGHSGANGFMDVTPANNFAIKKPIRGLAEFLLWRVVMPIKQGKNTWYSPDSLLLELRVIADMHRRENHIYHFLSAENEYLLSGKFTKRRNHHLIGTFHLPINRLIRVLNRYDDIKLLDAVVLVSSNMEEYFQEIMGEDRVHVLPLGTDTEYWKPSEQDISLNKKPNVLFVGAHLRDFETLRMVIEYVNQTALQIQFTAVVSKMDAKALIGLPNVTTLSGINDEKLLELYQSSSAMICPLLECTASNSILEAMSCGLPSVITGVGGVFDYLNDQCAVFTPPREPEVMADQLIKLVMDPSRRSAMGKAARTKALTLDWSILSKRMVQIYKKTINQ